MIPLRWRMTVKKLTKVISEKPHQFIDLVKEFLLMDEES
jgi:hypothetical protein